ncbi:hypothetical protein ES703_89163 [subsurface metagenome]
MLFTSPVYSQASGSIAGVTYSHNRGGMYTRARVTPTDPSSSRQQGLRAAMGTLAPYWGQTLDAAQRAAWDLYAANVPWQNPLGQTIFLTGQQHFLRCNVPRIPYAIAILDDAPEVYDLGTFTAPTIFSAKDNDNFQIAFTNTDEWASNIGGYLLPYAGKQQGPGRAFYRGPWRAMSAIAGAEVPPESPDEIGTTYPPLTEDNIVWLQCRIIQVDGRLSLPIILGPKTITAAV